MDEGFPRWVEYEIHNWARGQWDGEWPGPRPMLDELPDFCDFPPNLGKWEESEPDPIPINHERAQQVHVLYEALPFVEQRVIQAEYTRRAEYGDMPAHLRQASACRKLGIMLPYYKIALGNFKQMVMERFE